MTGRRVLLLLILFLFAVLEWGLLIYLISKGTEKAKLDIQPLLQLSSSSARFLSPEGGAILFHGQTVTVEVESPPLDLTGAELWINGRKALPLPRSMVRYPNRWIVTFLWEAPSPASYTLEAVLTSSRGEITKTTPLSVEVIPPLYFCFATDLNGNYDIYRMRADGSSLEPLLNSPADEREPSIAPNGTMAFVKGEGIWLKGHNGLKFIAQGREPTFDPSGRYLVFRASSGGTQELFLYSLQDGSVRQLTSGNAFAGQPSWSPDGEKIAFTSLKEGNWDIYLIRRDGSGLIRLTDNPAQDWHPAWSPDGDKIAFVSSRDGSHQLYFLATDSGNLEKITDIPGGVEKPIFSPDGRLLAFTAYTGEGVGFSAREIHLLSLRTRWLRRITYDSFDQTDLIWCPHQ